MIKIDIGENIALHYCDPMQDTIEILHTNGDTYANATACGDKLTHLHKELQRLDFPYFFVKLVTTNQNIKHELEILHNLYSNEISPLKFEIVQGDFSKSIYKGETMCALPWIHKYVNPQGLVMPCCVGNEDYPLGNLHQQSLEEISTETVRNQMLQGQRPDACSRCWQYEDQGIISDRQNANEEWAHCKDQKEFQLKFLDIRLSNKCNLMCRMCSGKFSNRIAQEEEKLYGFTKYKDEVLDSKLVEKQLQYIKNNLHSIESVYFAGGEPLINHEHYRILDLLIENSRTDVTLSYNTNFSILAFKKYNLLEYWQHFKNITIGASIDLIGDQSNYARHGVDYDAYEKNYEIIKDLKNIRFKISSVLHLMNIYNLPELQKRWIELGLNCENIGFNILVNPDNQAITVLPEHYKNLALVKIDSHIEFLKTVPDSALLISKWREAQEFMTSKNDTYLLGEFFRLNDDKDKNRNQVFEDYFPEYKDLRNYA